MSWVVNSAASQARAHIVMLLSNAYQPDPRVQREAAGLIEGGYRVSVICWDRRHKYEQHEIDDGIEIIRIGDVASEHGLGWRQGLVLPRFWLAAFRAASILKPAAIHCHDLDTLAAGWLVKRRLGCPLVYDAHENYPAQMSLYLPAAAVRGLSFLERWLLRRADVTITASTFLRDTLQERGARPVYALGNFPDLEPYAAVTAEAAARLRQRLDIPEERLLVAYIGGFSRNRMLLTLLEAADLLPDVSFRVWGDGVQRSQVEAAAAGRTNTCYGGWLAPDELPLYFRAADIIYYGLRADYPGALFNAPNTIGQAMAAGTPVIATDIGDLGRIVRETQCGVLLPEVTIASVAEAVSQLSSRPLREQLGANGRRAAIERYNAAAVKGQLRTIYGSLLANESA